MNAPEVEFPNLGIKIVHLPKEAFHIGPLPIYWYGICIVLGVAIATYVAVREAKRLGQNSDNYLDFLFYALIFGLIGARLYYVVFRWDDYKDNLLNILAFREGGLAIYGAVIAAFITAIVYTRIKKLNFWSFADVCAPSLILGQAIGRWGNFFNREVFGHYDTSLFAMRYLVDQVNDKPASVMAHVVEAYGQQYIQVQPTFLYESAWNLLIFILLMLYRKRKKRDGEIILLYLFGYGAGRFVIEGIRTDQLFLFGTNIPVSQLLSAILVVVSAIVLIMRRKNVPVPAVAAVVEPAEAGLIDTGDIEKETETTEGSQKAEATENKEDAEKTNDTEKVNNAEETGAAAGTEVMRDSESTENTEDSEETK